MSKPNIFRRSLRFRSSPLDTPERNDLKAKRKEKQTKFAWLAKFLGMRPSAKTLEDKGILRRFYFFKIHDLLTM